MDGKDHAHLIQMGSLAVVCRCVCRVSYGGRINISITKIQGRGGRPSCPWTAVTLAIVGAGKKRKEKRRPWREIYRHHIISPIIRHHTHQPAAVTGVWVSPVMSTVEQRWMFPSLSLISLMSSSSRSSSIQGTDGSFSERSEF
jgi:hypothetical protein